MAGRLDSRAGRRYPGGVFGHQVLIASKLAPPAVKGAHLNRPRLLDRLDRIQQHRLTTVVAGAGFGKTTLLSQWAARSSSPVLWYDLTERDADPQVLALHLAHLLHADAAREILEQQGGAARHGVEVFEHLAAAAGRCEAGTTLVLDGFQSLHAAPLTLDLLDRFTRVLPTGFAVVVASREPPALADLPRWSLEGEVLEVGATALAFSASETGELFERLQGQELAAEAAAGLQAATGGWPMAVQLACRLGAPDLVAEGGRPRRDLFDYLAREVLSRVPSAGRELLLAVAPLDTIDAGLAATLLDESRRSQGPEAEVARVLAALADTGLLTRVGAEGRFASNPIFRDFLLAELQAAGNLANARRASARALASSGRAEDALALWQAAGEEDEAAETLAAIAPGLVEAGRIDTLLGWADRLPQAAVAARAQLCVAVGDACRLGSRFDRAIEFLKMAAAAALDPAERGRALAAQARVYLDTVQPTRAIRLLDEALAALPPGADRDDALLLLAENKINMGDVRAAEALLQQAAERDPRVLLNRSRLLLRTGRLRQVRALLDTARAVPHASGAGPGVAADADLRQSDAGSLEPTQAHREADLVMSLVEALMGDADRALALASGALDRAHRQGAPYTEAAALMRRGHAKLVLGDAAGAVADYDAAVELANRLGIARLGVEARMGQLMARARLGRPFEAGEAELAVDTARFAGDPWMAAFACAGIGHALARCGDPHAGRWLDQAAADFERTGDGFGMAVALLGRAVLDRERGDPAAMKLHLQAVEAQVRRNGSDFLLERPTLLGFASPDAMSHFFAFQAAGGMPPLAASRTVPTERLRIRTMGGFRLEVAGTASWRRGKARELLHLLITRRGEWLPKVQIIDTLWPELGPEVADGTFRVALNALNKVLEPDRPSGQNPRHVVKQAGSYRIDEASVWIDVAEAERLLDSARSADLATAVNLYRKGLELMPGPFLAEFPGLGSWCDRERERLEARFTDASLHLVRLLLAAGQAEEAVGWAERLIARDPCAEEGYRQLMEARFALGDRVQALKAYDRCLAALDAELGVEPMPETRALKDRILSAAPPVTKG